MKLQKFSVRGKGAFPFDMLRYDSCFPSSQEDAISISLCAVCDWDERSETRVVELERYVDTKSVDPMPHEKRWRSFGWEVLMDTITTR